MAVYKAPKKIKKENPYIDLLLVNIYHTKCQKCFRNMVNPKTGICNYVLCRNQNKLKK